MSGKRYPSGDSPSLTNNEVRRLLDDLIQLLARRGPNRFTELRLQAALHQIAKAHSKVSYVDEDKVHSMPADALGTYERLFGFNAAGRNYFRREGGKPWRIQPEHVRITCFALHELEICADAPDFDDDDETSWIAPLEHCLTSAQYFFSEQKKSLGNAGKVGDAAPQSPAPNAAPEQSSASVEIAQLSEVGAPPPVAANSRSADIDFLHRYSSTRYLMAGVLLFSVGCLGIIAVTLAFRTSTVVQVTPGSQREPIKQSGVPELLASSITAANRSDSAAIADIATVDTSSSDAAEALRNADPRLRQALQLDQQGKHDAARDLRRVVAREHREASNANRKIETQTHRDLATSAGVAGDIDEQIREWTAVVDLDANANDHNELGVAYRNKGDDESASEHFQAAIDADSNFAWPLSNFGNIFYDRGQYEDAVDYYSKAIMKVEKFAVAYGNRGNAYQKLKRYDAAIADYNQAVKLNSDFANAFNGRGNTYSAIGNYEAALADYDQAIKLDSNLAQAFSNRGNLHRSHGEIDQARQDYDEAIRLDDNLAPAYNGRGLLLARQGEYDNAIAQYDRAIRLDPGFADAFSNRGYAMLLANRYDEAVKSFTRAIELSREGENFDAFFGRGLAYAWGATGPRVLELAIDDFVTSTRMDPKSAESFAQLGNAYSELGRYTAAALNLQQALQVNPKSFAANGFTCLLQMRRQKFSEALPYCDKLVELEPQNGFGFFLRGDLFLRKGDKEKDLKDTEKGIKDLEQCAHLSAGTGISALAEFLMAVVRPQYDSAFDAAARGLSLFPVGSQRAGLLVARASLYVVREEWDNALRDYDEALKERPTPLVYSYRAAYYLRREQYDEALKDYNKILEIAPDYPGALQVRARIRGHTDRGAALRDYDELIKQEPSLSALTERAELRSDAGDREGTLDDLEQALKLAQGRKRAMVFTQRAGVHEKFGDRESAYSDYDNAVNVDKNDASPWFWSARAFAAVHDDERALANFDKVIQLAPNFVEAYLEAGDLYFSAGKFDNALGKLNQIEARDHNQPLVYYRRGRVRYAMQEFALALLDFERAGTLGWGDSAAILYITGTAQLHLGKYNSAISNYLETAAQEPDFAYAALALYLARAKEGEKAPGAELVVLSKKLNKTEWPYPIVELFMDQRSANAVFVVAEDDARRCEANFYVGEWELSRANVDKAITYLNVAVDTCPKRSVEYADAIFELRRLQR